MELLHATCVAVGGKGVLLRGPSGSGKSDLALRLIAGGATLVADDYVALKKDGQGLKASPPSKIAGKMEIRGIGVTDFKSRENVPVTLIVDLVPRDHVARLPEDETTGIAGVSLPVFKLHAFDASTPEKIRLLLKRF